MKKLLVLLFASLLVLGACGQKEESSSKDDTKETKEVKKENKKEDKKESKDKEVSKKTDPKSEEQSTEEVATNEQQSTQETAPTEEVTQEQQTVEQPVQQPQQTEESSQFHYDPEYDRYGYTGMVDETGMPELDPNENFDPHGGQVPNDNLTEEEIREMMGE